jgi:hypothetical protein
MEGTWKLRDVRVGGRELQLVHASWLQCKCCRAGRQVAADCCSCCGCSSSLTLPWVARWVKDVSRERWCVSLKRVESPELASGPLM